MADAAFATYAGDGEDLYQASVLLESIRTFGGGLRDLPVWIVLGPGCDPAIDRALPALRTAEIWRVEIPEAARRFPFAGKSFAAALAERRAVAAKIDRMIWMDCDTIVLREPSALLPDRMPDLGATPVFHQLIGSLHGQPPDPFWTRVYDLLGVRESAAFPVETPVDRKTLRAYFNCGLLVVRTNRGILGEWRDCFVVLSGDDSMGRMCDGDELIRVFLHQVALAGAILRKVKREDVHLYGRGINYSVFLQGLYPDEARFDSLDGLVTLRYDVAFRNPGIVAGLSGPAGLVSWIGERFAPERYRCGM
jgi:hypothetical protein